MVISSEFAVLAAGFDGVRSWRSLLETRGLRDQAEELTSLLREAWWQRYILLRPVRHQPLEERRGAPRPGHITVNTNG